MNSDIILLYATELYLYERKDEYIMTKIKYFNSYNYDSKKIPFYYYTNISNIFNKIYTTSIINITDELINSILVEYKEFTGKTKFLNNGVGIKIHPSLFKYHNTFDYDKIYMVKSVPPKTLTRVEKLWFYSTRGTLAEKVYESNLNELGYILNDKTKEAIILNKFRISYRCDGFSKNNDKIIEIKTRNKDIKSKNEIMSNIKEIYQIAVYSHVENKPCDFIQILNDEIFIIEFTLKELDDVFHKIEINLF